MTEHDQFSFEELDLIIPALATYEASLLLRPDTPDSKVKSVRHLRLRIQYGKAIAEAYRADAAFADAITSAGYRSRWDWKQSVDKRPYAAYLTKIQADERMNLLAQALREVIR